MEGLMTRLTLASSLLVSASLAGCGSVDTETPDPADTTAPTILKATPGAGEAGVPADAAIVIEFSEPMDKASVEAAYASSDLPAANVTMSWNDAGDTLTVVPKQPLELAEGIGDDPSVVTAKAYALSLAATATDPAGNPLASALDLSFTTFKRMETSTLYIGDLTRFRTSTGAVSSLDANLLIGDSGALTARGFVTFDLAALPNGAEIEMAGFGVRQIAVAGDPFAAGVMNTVHVTYDAVSTAAWDAPALAMMDPLTTTAGVGPRTVDVTAAVADDYAQRTARGNRSQFRLEFSAASAGTGDTNTVTLATTTFAMLIVYLAP
jgi:hypothetical protein